MDRLYKVINFEYVRDVGKNMIELNIIPDEDLILYLNSIPKLEPQIFISVNGYCVNTNTVFNCNYYASCDSISTFYESNVNYIVFTIFTDKADRVYEYISFPKSNIKQKFIKQETCNEYTSFNGSNNPPLAVYNPFKGKFDRFKRPKKQIVPQSNLPTTQTSDLWEMNACSHGVCKAEQTTEPPLLNSLVDLSEQYNTIEYFQHCDTVPSVSKIVCFNKTSMYMILFLIIAIIVIILFKNVLKTNKWKY
jgi:hypothetical protein